MSRYWLVPVLALGAVIVAALDPDTGLRSWQSLRERLGESQVEVRWLEAELERLRREGRDLSIDPLAVERAIREELGLARPGEVVVLFRDSDSATY